MKSKKVEDITELPVIQYTKDKEFVAEYKSVYDAYLTTGISQDVIKRVCRGGRNYAGGFWWSYKKDIKKDIKKDVLNTDRWNIIEEFPDYKISRKGVVWNCLNECIIEPFEDKEKGVLKVHLYKDGVDFLRSIHTLVALAYIPKPPGNQDYIVKHKNLNKLDNHIGNLMWSVREKGKAVVQCNSSGQELNRFNSIKEASLATKAAPDVITRVCNAGKGTAAGYRWKWLKDIEE